MPNDGVIIRPAKEEEWRFIRNKIEEVDELIKFHIPGYRSFFVAVVPAGVQDQIVGFCALAVNIMEDLNEEEKVLGRSPKSAEIRCLWVEPEFRRGWVAQRLVAACDEKARVLGVYEAFSFTDKTGFFRRCGFKTADEKTGKCAVFKVYGNGINNQGKE